MIKITFPVRVPMDQTFIASTSLEEKIARGIATACAKTQEPITTRFLNLQTV